LLTLGSELIACDSYPNQGENGYTMFISDLIRSWSGAKPDYSDWSC